MGGRRAPSGTRSHRNNAPYSEPYREDKIEAKVSKTIGSVVLRS